ncbi:MAG: DUF3515 family protein [Microbacterium pygmaeum]|uniref:DUF3515 domain-containing protein n=1 Tax=Microbacterium pygmaeum TaxID=370764 RepID=A0A1G8A3F8_9MICO|nr:DUF3515 family protein [Microbacterium pygmaeum]SDH15401.1 Protein of unknown function [Microbacterium pygmaeum]
MRSRIPVAAAAVIACTLAGFALSGCSSTVSMEAAADADDPLCADVTVRLPGEIDGQIRRWTDAQATGAWGDPAAVLVTCGVSAPGPTEEKCITIGGVDWIVDESAAPRFLVTTYGRTPAVQVFYDNEIVSGNDVLDRLSTSVSQLPVDGQCTSTETLLPAP